MEMSDLLKSVVKGLNDEQKEKVKACKSPDEVIACLGELGVELPDELLDAVAGGLNPAEVNDQLSIVIGKWVCQSIMCRYKTALSHYTKQEFNKLLSNHGDVCPKCGCNMSWISF